MARSTTSTGAAFRTRAEHRWPVIVAIAVAVVLYSLLPDTFASPLRYTVAAICAVSIVPLVLYNPARMNRESRVSRLFSLGISLLLLVANQVALVQLIVELVLSTRKDGPIILLASVQVWVTNIIGYSLVYWEMDRGGPVVRRRDPREKLPAADFRFPQDEDDDTVTEVSRKSSKVADWMPSYLDYLYFSATDSMAFSPTDTMPLSHRAKALMLLEALSGFVILALVIARSVSLLG